MQYSVSSLTCSYDIFEAYSHFCLTSFAIYYSSAQIYLNLFIHYLVDELVKCLDFVFFLVY